MPDPSLTQSEARVDRRLPTRAMTNLTNVTHPTKKNSINALASRTDIDADTPFASRPDSEIDGGCENEGSTRQDISAPPSQLGMKDLRSRAFSAMAVDGSAPPSRNQLMQNYRASGKGPGRIEGRVFNEDWVVHDDKNRAIKEMEQVVEEHVPEKQEGSADPDVKEDETKETDATQGKHAVKHHKQNTI